MREPCVEVRRPNGETKRFQLAHSELIVGRSTQADVSLPAETALELEHLLLVPRGKTGCWVSVAAHVDDVSLNGSAFRAGLVPWGAELQVGHLRVRLTECPDRPRLRRVRVLLFGATAALIALGIWLLLSEGSTPATGSPAVSSHPPLFSERGRCPEAQEVLQAARELERRASSHFVRYVYEPSDGVKAVLRLQEAAACYARAGSPAEVARLGTAIGKFRDRVEADYAAVRLRLHGAIERARWAEVARAARQLQRLTAHLEGNEYVQWLQSIEARAVAKH